MTHERHRGFQRSRSHARREALFFLAFALLLLWLAPVLARAQAPDTLVLRWTAPADMPGAATVARYDIRWSASPITASNFATALVFVNPPSPSEPGSPESLVVRGLAPGQPVWFALKSADVAGNWSAISNVVRWNGSYDTSPPSAPQGVTASQVPGGSVVNVSWVANSEPDLSGYNVYRATASAGPWTKLNASTLVANAFTDNALPGGANKLWYQASAIDQSSNESARSAASVVSVVGVLGAVPNAWRLEPAYPNPAHAGQPVQVPLEVPPGAGAARLQILDGGGQLVREFDVPPGFTGLTRIAWDGTNGRGRECAPGVYRACLIAGNARQFVRIARVP
jgi:hypothetical protein